MTHPSTPEEEVARHWDDNAARWAEQVRRGWDVCRETFNNPAFFDLLGDVRGKDVLDAGCGEGHNTRLLARMGARVTAIDISPRMIELARAEEAREPLSIRYEVASFSDMPLFADASFDLVVSTMAVMDGPDLAGAFHEIYRVLRPGGRLTFSVTHPCFMTRGFGWERDDNGSATRLLISGYFNHEPWVERWKFEHAPDDVAPFAVPSFPRTLSDYVNGLIDAGFTLRELREPRPSEEACREHPSLRGWREHGALFLHFKAEKPP
ncbi:MAG: methyltransferase domain-containing protein [Dehalococcoidia bacterium]|nr:methyltransferase domain-containing protein [Dehalococcoidia bacterium]